MIAALRLPDRPAEADAVVGEARIGRFEWREPGNGVLVQRTDAPIPLDEAMLVISAHALDVGVEAGLRQLDEVAAATTDARTGDVAGFADLLDRLFVDLGFAGNRGDYGDPRNSFLPSVIERRLGIRRRA